MNCTLNKMKDNNNPKGLLSLIFDRLTHLVRYPTRLEGARTYRFIYSTSLKIRSRFIILSKLIYCIGTYLDKNINNLKHRVVVGSEINPPNRPEYWSLDDAEVTCGLKLNCISQRNLHRTFRWAGFGAK